MANVKEFKCPACGGTLEFDSKSQKMKCPYCDTEFDVKDFIKDEEETKPKADEIKEEVESEDEEEPLKKEGIKDGEWTSASNSTWDKDETDGMKVYVCKSCGGEIIADDTTGATECPFCGNKVLIKEQFSGDLKPDYIIPFKLNKKDAKEAYKNHLKGKPFLPKIFKDENHIDEIKGMYVPFWLFDVEADASVTYKGENLKIWQAGNTEYTEHTEYKAFRAGSISFEHIPADGSKKMDDTLMESIEPFDFSEAVPFSSAYLAGYLADRYDVNAEKRIKRTKERVKSSAEKEFYNTVTGYDAVTVQRSYVDISQGKYWYALYPIWLLNTTWNGKKFVFAMNGQTGKMVGDLPVDKSLFWKYVGIRTPIYSAVILAIAFIVYLL